MTGEEALTAYGYVQGENGRLIRPGKATQQWKRTDDGAWLRFEADGSQTAFSANAAGVDMANPDHADKFVWEWPDEEVARIYGHAVDQASQGWPDANLEPA